MPLTVMVHEETPQRGVPALRRKVMAKINKCPLRLLEKTLVFPAFALLIVFFSFLVVLKKTISIANMVV